MRAWIVYDITQNRRRQRIVRACRDFGLIRAQKSVFVGIVDDSRLESFFARLRSEMDENEDSVFVLPTDKRLIEEGKYFGKGFDKALAMRETDILFL
jgi:CRISPR-associated protein Cas2